MTNEATGVQRYDYGTDAGMGFEGASGADFTIPFLKLLQTNSPEISDPTRRIPGATAGMFMNTATQEIFPGTGLIFVPAARERRVMEWIPRDSGGGFVGQFDPEAPIVLAAAAQAKKTKHMFKWITPTGNELVDTYYLYGFVLRSIEDTEHAGFVVIPFAKTKIKSYKAVMYRMRTRKGKPPMFSNRLLLSSVDDKNKIGQPFKNTEIRFVTNNDPDASAIAPGSPLLEAGKELNRLVVQGLAKIDISQQESAHHAEPEEEAAF